MKVYIYNENCTMAGHSAAQSRIDDSDDPENDGDWTCFEGTEEELIAQAAGLRDSAQSQGAGTDRFYRQCAKTLLCNAGYRDDEISEFLYGKTPEDD